MDSEECEHEKDAYVRMVNNNTKTTRQPKLASTTRQSNEHIYFHRNNPGTSVPALPLSVLDRTPVQ